MSEEQKLPAEIEAAITALAETVTHKEIVFAREALRSAVLKWGQQERTEGYMHAAYLETGRTRVSCEAFLPQSKSKE